MKISIPDISRQIYQDEVLTTLERDYKYLGPVWMSQQMEWLNGVYTSFKDHDKFLILIFLIKKTLDFYSRNLVKLSFDEFYSKDTVSIEKFNISDVSKNLKIPKESARRKVLELEKEKILIRKKKEIIIDRSAFPYVKPINSVIRISRFVSLLSNSLAKDKIISKKFSSIEVENCIKKNFSIVWNLYYEMQISNLQNWKKLFLDLETWHIFGVCAVNQSLQAKKLSIVDTTEVFFNNIYFANKKLKGINAMSISDITGIPRATVVRKLNRLLKNQYLKVSKKKHYTLRAIKMSNTLDIHKVVMKRLSSFSSEIHNLLVL